MAWGSCFLCYAGRGNDLKVHRRYSLFLALTILALITVVTAQSIYKLPYQVRFSLPALNYWVGAGMALSMPFLLFWISLSLGHKWIRGLVMALSILLLLPSLVISGCAALEAPTVSEKVDGSYELISEASRDSSKFRLYRTNCGATCVFGLDLREEHEMFLGMKLVSPIWSLYRASEGRVVVEKSTVSVLHGTDVLVVLQK
jgi:hypothetical protein